MKKSSNVNLLHEIIWIKSEKSSNCSFELNLNFFKTTSSALPFENKNLILGENEYTIFSIKRKN